MKKKKTTKNKPANLSRQLVADLNAQAEQGDAEHIVDGILNWDRSINTWSPAALRAILFAIADNAPAKTRKRIARAARDAVAFADGADMIRRAAKLLAIDADPLMNLAIKAQREQLLAKEAPALKVIAGGAA